ncbi:hypothetical protein POTOM_053025 [Populus tomentosa]|uniref:Uncharacterized protein n=1 Tax=Populus tomentosa TaxID=118781 RepID=A0A8X8C0T3_POPTO|nr:hypothetical protein POTOM_053025 [Populus tomentosa]
MMLICSLFCRVPTLDGMVPPSKASNLLAPKLEVGIPILAFNKLTCKPEMILSFSFGRMKSDWESCV